jgi:hypothetical protein
MKNNNYIVKFIKSGFYDIQFIVYIKRIISYKNKKLKWTMNMNEAHKYVSEQNATKAAQFFSGEIQII